MQGRNDNVCRPFGDRCRRRILTWATGLIAAIAMLALATAPAAAQDAGQDDENQELSLFVEPPTVEVGGFIDVSGTCGPEAANTTISIGLGGDLGNNIVGANVDTDDAGEFQTAIVLPDDAPTAEGVVYAACDLPSGGQPTAPLTILGDADDPSATTPYLDINPATATRGATIGTVGSCGLAWANSTISIVLDGDDGRASRVDNVPTGPRGRFSGSFTLPLAVASGQFDVSANCPAGTGLTPTAALTIVEDDDGPDGGRLRVDPQRTVVGGLITVVGSCGPDAAESVSLVLGGEVERGTIATNIDADADADGDFQASVLLPDDVPTGDGELIAACGVGVDLAPTASLTIFAEDSDDGDDGDNADDGRVLGFGDRGLLVEYWQRDLSDWLVLSGRDFSLAVDGVFGPRTELATRIFQDATDEVAADGDVDPEDRVALRTAIDDLEADDSPDQSTVIERGDRGRLVELWQDRLNDWLALTGSDLVLVVDGIFGPRTDQVTLRFQNATDEVVTDGIVDPVDRVALRNAIDELQADDPSDGDEPVEQTPVGVYFLSDDALVVGERIVPDPRRVDVALRELLDGPDDGLEADLGWSSAVPSGARVLSLVVTPTRAVIEFSDEFETASDPVAALAQIVFTLTQSPDIDAVEVLVDGAPLDIEDVGSTVDLTRDTFTQQVFAADPMPLILVESPRVGAEVGSTLTLSGTSNTFEANVRFQVTDSDGVVIIDDNTTATAGTGTWGTFEETVALPGFDRDGVISVLVFEDSARDGSPTNVVEVPVFVEGSS